MLINKVGTPMMASKKQALPYSITGLNPYPWIRWWYALVAPPAPIDVAELPLKEREFLRRGKLTSIALLIEFIELSLELLPTIQAHQTTIIPFIVASLAFLVISMVLNRFGKLFAAGLLIILVMEVGMNSPLVSPQSGPLSFPQLQYLAILVQPLMISALLFPPRGVLVVGAINVITTILTLTIVPKTPDLQAYMRTPAGVPVFAIPIMSLIICALVSFVVITSLQESLVRADKAEEVNKLNQAMAEQTRRELQTKRQLEMGVQEIVTSMTNFANGDLRARIRLEHGHLLWSVASSINNMIGRFVRIREQGQSIEQTSMALHSYLMVVRTAKTRGVPLPLPNTGTPIDKLVEELLSYPSPLAPQPSQQHDPYSSPLAPQSSQQHDPYSSPLAPRPSQQHDPYSSPLAPRPSYQRDAHSSRPLE